MSLTIKNPETRRLAEELAALTNENKTEAITIALRERLEREKERQEKIAAIHAIGQRAAARMGPGPSWKEIRDSMYGDHGEPI